MNTVIGIFAVIALFIALFTQTCVRVPFHVAGPSGLYSIVVGQCAP